MKLKMLLQTFEFEDIYPTIVTMYPNAKRHKKEFRNAYDLLLGLRPVASKKDIRYMIIQAPNSNDSYFGAQNNNFDTTWEVLVGKNVVREKYVDLTDEEIAANCIINAIFIGKHPQEFDQDYRTLTRG